ncbi:MAG: aminotransferase class I/II-fold pyridoxal phosphate-dependent enzyme [Clostridiales bacterium]
MNMSDKIVDSVKNAPPSGIRKYFDLINEMKDAISLGVGEPDFVTPWKIREEGIYSLEKGHTHYSSNSGFAELREQISKYLYRKYGLKYDSKTQTLVTVGASEGIDLALRTLASDGDEVIIPEPSFVSYQGCTMFTGAKAVTIDLKNEDNFRLKAIDLEKTITKRTKVIILPFPNNPTGAILEKKDLDDIVEVLKDRDIIVISDEIYSELNYSGKHISIASYPEMYEKTVVINGFSKAYAMTGWRLGYVCGHPELISAMQKIHQYSLMCSPTTAQYAAIEALKSCDDDIDKMIKEYNQRRRLMVDGFRKLGLECFEPMGAFYVFPSIKSLNIKSDEFCEAVLKEEKVLIVPGNAFGKCGEGFFRATYANSVENIIEAMKRIGNYINKIKET